jgi:hypothetical protein
VVVNRPGLIGAGKIRKIRPAQHHPRCLFELHGASYQGFKQNID